MTERIKIEKLHAGYRLLAYPHRSVVVQARDLLDIMDYALEHAEELRQEAKTAEGLKSREQADNTPRSGECVECGRPSSRLTENGYCEGCVMQGVIDAMEPQERWK